MAEVVSLGLEDLKPGGPPLLVKVGLDEGDNTGSTVTLGFRAAHLLTTWLALRGLRPGRLFLPVYAASETGGSGRGVLSGLAAQTAAKKGARRAGLARPAVSLKDLRRTALDALLRSGEDLVRPAGTLAENVRDAGPPESMHERAPYVLW